MQGIFPTAYFGSIAYFQELVRFTEISIEVKDHFPKQTFRNRCSILSPQGSLRLTVPVEKTGGSKTPTESILVSGNQDWRRNHWRAIMSAYASAPYFDHYGMDIRRLIESDYPSLIALNTEITHYFLAAFGFEVSIGFTDAFLADYPTNDFRAKEYDSELPEDFSGIPYKQVYFGREAFVPNQSVLDLLFCEGPMGRKQLL